MKPCGCKGPEHCVKCRKFSSDAQKAVTRENKKLDNRKGTLR